MYSQPCNQNTRASCLNSHTHNSEHTRTKRRYLKYQSEDGYQDDNTVKFVPAVEPILVKTVSNHLRHQESMITQAMPIEGCRGVVPCCFIVPCTICVNLFN